MRDVSNAADFPLTVFYAFKQSEDEMTTTIDDEMASRQGVCIDWLGDDARRA